MEYYFDDEKADLGALKQRLETTDLIPSQKPLLDGLGGNISALKRAGIASIADLRRALKSDASLDDLARNSGLDGDYLRLLRRTIKGFFPKPRSLGEVDWLGSDAVAVLKGAGIKNTRQVFEAASGDAGGFSKRTGIGIDAARELMAISDLCRVQWVSPSFARVLVAAGYPDAGAVARANADTLFEDVKSANQGATYYKGTVGLRDISRLVDAAQYVPLER